MSTPEAGFSGVRAALAELLGWDEIERSPQLTKFLSYVVEAKLAGDEQKVKAYAIAVDVFGRPATFDPQRDPIVRVQARRLRQLIDRYYASGLARAPVRIRLPVGRYIPEFEARQPEIADAPSSESEQPAPMVADLGGRGSTAGEITASLSASLVSAAANEDLSRRGWLRSLALAAAGVAMVAVLVAVLLMARGWIPSAPPASSPTPPVIFVGSFSNLTGLPVFDDMAGRLKTTVTTMLSAFPEFRVAAADTAKTPAQPGLFLTGLIRRTDKGVDISLLLTGKPGGAVAWNAAVLEPLDSGNPGRVAAAAARQLVGQLATFRGPLYTAGRSWLAQQRQLETEPTPFACLLRFRLTAENGNSSDGDAIACFERLLANKPDTVSALAGQSWLKARAAYVGAGADASPGVLLEPAVAMARRAKELSPSDAFAGGVLARVLDLAGQHRLAMQTFAESLGANPADLDVRAAYAQALAFGGDWELAASEASAALEGAPSPPTWYHVVPALDAYRRGDYRRATEEALLLAPGGTDFASALAVAAGARAGRPDVVGRFLPALLTNASYRSGGILTRLSRRLNDPTLLAAIRDGLSLAGVPQSAMMQPF